MNVFKNIFKTRNTSKDKIQYLSGWEVTLDGQEHCRSFVKTQIVSEQTIKNIDTFIELTFGENDLLKQVKLYSDGAELTSGSLFDNLKIEEALGKFEYQDYPINNVYSLELSKTGLNYLGGEPTNNFEMPPSQCIGSFQYLGLISHQDTAFNWLPFDLHLVCPIYLDIDKVWLDYSNPLKPVIINKEEIDNVGSGYDDLKDDSFVIFEKKNFQSNKIKHLEYDIGLSGIPNWIQYPEIPFCPKSGKPMKFLLQLGDYAGVKVLKTNVNPEDDWYKTYFEEMNFWGDGDLFVFFEPETKIACYFIQNT